MNVKTCFLLLTFVLIALWQGSTSIHRYASPTGAIEKGGRVQVMGRLMASAEGYAVVGEKGDRIMLDTTAKELRLDPGNQVVAVGVVRQGQLVVERLLYKCPSKYEGGQ